MAGREAVPRAAITTDLIVGFPGESEADFDDTLSLLRAVRYHSVFSLITVRCTNHPVGQAHDG